MDLKYKALKNLYSINKDYNTYYEFYDNIFPSGCKRKDFNGLYFYNLGLFNRPKGIQIIIKKHGIKI